MKILLNNIEKSEDNNPLLTAALKEIEALNKKLFEIKSIIETTGEVKERTDNGPYRVLQGYEEIEAKMRFIASIITPDC